MYNSKYIQKLKDNNKDAYIELLEMAIDLSIVGFTIADEKGNVLKINEAQTKITGHDYKKTVGRNLADIAKENNNTSATMKVIKYKKSVNLEQQQPTGESYFVHGEPYFDKSGKIKYIISNLIDTTEISSLKKELEKLQEDRDRLTKKVQQIQSKNKASNCLIYISETMNNVIKKCSKIAPFDSTVLITGKSGVGKELIADYIVENSYRKEKPYIKINCAAIPSELLESELFGYESGAFTGAKKTGKIGIFEKAKTGTILLDEINELPLKLQTKLLRFMQEREFYRVGGNNPIFTDVRILAATNKSLEDEVMKNRFREDLFYRLNVIPIKVPSLQERKEDIPYIIKHYSDYYNEKYKVNKKISPEVINYLKEQNYEGNVRELINIVERAMLLTSSSYITIKDINEEIDERKRKEKKDIDCSKGLKTLLEDYEKDILSKCLEVAKTTQEASEILDVSQPTISRKLKKYNIYLYKNE